MVLTAVSVGFNTEDKFEQSTILIKIENIYIYCILLILD